MNKTEVMDKLGPMANLHVRRVESNPGMRVTVGVDGAMELRPTAHANAIAIRNSDEVAKRVLGFARVPDTVAKNLSVDTMGRVLSDCLRSREAFQAILQDDQVIDLVKDGSRRDLDPERMLENVEKVLGEGVNYNRVHQLEAYASNLEIVGVEERPVARGDLVRAGISLTFSPIGVVNPEVSSFALRLICTNGATHLENIGRYAFTGDSGDGGVWNWLRKSVKDAYGGIGGIVDRFQAMLAEGIPPEQRAMVVEALIKQARLPSTVAAEIRAMAVNSPPENSYEAMNLITWAASHRLSGPAALRAQRGVSDYISSSEHNRVCPICHRGTDEPASN